MLNWWGRDDPCTAPLTAAAIMPNRIPVECPACHHGLKIRAEFFGQDVSCRYCDHTFPLSDRVLIACPTCGQEGPVPVAWLGRWVRCPSQGHPFPAEPEYARVLPGSTPPTDRPGPTLLDIAALLRRVEELERDLRAAHGIDPGGSRTARE